MIQDLCNHIYKTLGPGFSERVYHNAMEVMLRQKGINYETERIVPIVFEGHTIGNVRADIIIDGAIVLEFKAIKSLTDVMELQARNYLNLMNLNEAYLVNFPPWPNLPVEIRKIVRNT